MFLLPECYRVDRARRPHAIGSSMALPTGIPSPKAPRQWESIRLALRQPPRRPLAIGKAFDLPLDCAHAVLQCAPPCAHQRHSNASHKAIAPHKPRATEKARERPIAKRPAFHTLWLVKGLIAPPPLTSQYGSGGRVKGLGEGLPFHKPIVQLAVCAKHSANG